MMIFAAATRTKLIVLGLISLSTASVSGQELGQFPRVINREQAGDADPAARVRRLPVEPLTKQRSNAAPRIDSADQRRPFPRVALRPKSPAIGDLSADPVLRSLADKRQAKETPEQLDGGLLGAAKPVVTHAALPSTPEPAGRAVGKEHETKVVHDRNVMTGSRFVPPAKIRRLAAIPGDLRVQPIQASASGTKMQSVLVQRAATPAKPYPRTAHPAPELARTRVASLPPAAIAGASAAAAKIAKSANPASDAKAVSQLKALGIKPVSPKVAVRKMADGKVAASSEAKNVVAGTKQRDAVGLRQPDAGWNSDTRRSRSAATTSVSAAQPAKSKVADIGVNRRLPAIEPVPPAREAKVARIRPLPIEPLGTTKASPNSKFKASSQNLSDAAKKPIFVAAQPAVGKKSGGALPVVRATQPLAEPAPFFTKQPSIPAVPGNARKLRSPHEVGSQFGALAARVPAPNSSDADENHAAAAPKQTTTPPLTGHRATAEQTAPAVVELPKRVEYPAAAVPPVPGTSFTQTPYYEGPSVELHPHHFPGPSDGSIPMFTREQVAPDWDRLFTNRCGSCTGNLCGCRHSYWVAEVGALFLDRSRADAFDDFLVVRDQTLDGIRSGDLDLETTAAARLSIGRRNLNGGLDWEASYFNLEDQSGSGALTGNLRVQGNTLIGAGTAVLDYDTELEYLNLGVGRYLTNWTRLVMGVNWLQLDEHMAISANTLAAPNFRNTAATENRLLGGHVGIEHVLWERGHGFTLTGAAKFGVAANDIKRTLSGFGTASLSERTTSLLGEFELLARYQWSDRWSFGAAYQLLAISDVALAANQMLQPTDVFTDESVLYYGFRFDLGYSW